MRQHIATTRRLTAAAAGWVLQAKDRLLRSWQLLGLDADERYLRQASDLADLELRLRRVARGRLERFGPIHPGA